jgi:hydroxymethylbilane synthase
MNLTPDGQTHYSIASDGNRSEAVEVGHKAGHVLRDRAGAGFFDGWA